jgi:uncharacterized protein
MPLMGVILVMDTAKEVIIFIIGFASAMYGTIVGAGGGFVFVPALLFLLNLPPNIAAGTGTMIVLINALSGIIGFIRQRRIEYQIGLIIFFGAFPGTVIGATLANIISEASFYWLFSTLLILFGILLLIKKEPKSQFTQMKIFDDESAATIESKWHKKKLTGYFLITGFLLGILSSIFGIGGGWLLVPILVYLFRISPHRATATSIFSLSFYAMVGASVHCFYGNIDWNIVIWGGLGVLIGAQLGVHISKKIAGRRIIQLLAILLIGIGIQMIMK